MVDHLSQAGTCTFSTLHAGLRRLFGDWDGESEEGGDGQARFHLKKKKKKVALALVLDLEGQTEL